jgi:hypothetical protein
MLPWDPSANCWMADQSPFIDECLAETMGAERDHKHIVFWHSMTTVMLLIGLAVTCLLGVFDPDRFLICFLTALADIGTFVDSVAQILDRTLRDLWGHS